MIGIDEVGRGAIAGPVAVAAALIDSKSDTFTTPWPSALADSKLMSARSREATAPLVQEWAAGVHTGFISAVQIDQIGITKCAVWPFRAEVLAWLNSQ